MTNENEEQVATRGQRRKIRAMLDGDRISAETAQALIEGKGWNGPGHEPHSELSRFFRMMNCVEEFGRAKPGLQNANEDHLQAAVSSVFWRWCVGHKVIEGVDVAEIFDKVDVLLADTLIEKFRSGIAPPLGRSLSEFIQRFRSFVDWEKSVPAVTKNMEEDPSLERFLNAHSYGFCQFWNEVFEDPSVMITMVASSRAMVWFNLYAIMFYHHYFVIIGDDKRAVELYKLLQLFMKGNYPLGFNKGDNLVVLVA
ncbi:MAG: hypothetical protein P1P90_03660 [Patescibacteria group bacterium]|nr:hypothetical protein [Patescibacteria group bacterium]